MVFGLQGLQDKICSMKNYSSAWVMGSDNQRTSNVLDHVACDQHNAAMSHLHTAQAKASSEPVTSYAPIAHALLMLDKPERARMRRKFEVYCLMAKEGIAFEKFPSLCELEAHHEVDLGHAYRTAVSAKSFTHYITQAQHEQFLRSLVETKFYSFLVDGSTVASLATYSHSSI